MSKISTLLVTALFAVTTGAIAQFAPGGTRYVVASSITSGNALGWMSDDLSEGNPTRRNKIWNDIASFWNAGAIPDSLEMVRMIHTKDADKATTGDTTILSVTLDDYAQVVVWYADSQATKPTWLTTNFVDCGIDVFVPATMSGYCAVYGPSTVNFGGNCPSGGCTNETPMYLVSIVPHWRPITFTAPSTGQLQFATTSVTCNEETVCNFQVCREGGTDGAASVAISEGLNPSFGTLNTTSLAWVSGEAGCKSGNSTLADVSGNQIMTLLLGSFVGATPGTPTSLQVNITDLDTSPTGVEFFVNPGSSTPCNNSNSGTDPNTAAWCTISRANAVTAHSSQDTIVWIQGGIYVNDLINPQNSGASASREIIFCPRGGNVTLRGPPTGAQATFGITLFDRTWFKIGDGCGNSFRIITDGQTVYGTGGGEVEKNEDPTQFSRMRHGALVGGNSADVVLDFDMIRTSGWQGIDVNAPATRVIMRPNFTQHGTTFFTTNSDYGDAIDVSQSIGSTAPLLVDGGTTGRTWLLPGHSHMGIGGGKLLMRGIMGDGSWGGMPTFSNVNPDGNRIFAISRLSTNSHAHDLIINRVGKPKDQAWQECFKIEGTRTAISSSVVRNCHGFAHNIASASWSWHARGGRIAHVTYQNLGGPIARLLDYTGTADTGMSPLGDFKWKNIIVDGFWQNPLCCGSSPWTDELFVFGLTGSQTLENIGFELDGATIRHASGNCNNVYIRVSGGSNSGRRNLPTWNSIYPNNIKNFTCVPNVNLSNSPPAGTNSTFSTWVTQYSPVNDTHSVAKGSNITTATEASSGGSDTSLPVADATWFVDPDSWPVPQVGQSSGSYTVHIAGVGNVAYTNITLGTPPAGTITLAVPAVWANGAAVNFGISSGGSVPNRGAIR